jgi:hypothetical protein
LIDASLPPAVAVTAGGSQQVEVRVLPQIVGGAIPDTRWRLR